MTKRASRDTEKSQYEKIKQALKKRYKISVVKFQKERNILNQNNVSMTFILI